MSDQLKISVVMATYKRADIVGETIRHIAEQDLDPASFELVIVDDGSPDRTREVIEAAGANVPFSLRYLVHENRGPGYTQNRGIEAARAPVVLLIADDILLTPGALSAHLALHTANPAPEVAVLGRVLQSPYLAPTVFLRTWDPFRFDRFDGMKEVPFYRFWACNISAKREFLLAHGGFREHMGRAGAAAHEDVELGCRLHRHGLRILYNREALGYHHHVVTLQQACDRSYQRGLNFGEFYALAAMPEIPVTYHVSPRRYARDYIEVMTGPRRRNIASPDNNPIVLALHQFARIVLFNRFTVPRVWRPLLDRFETDRRLAKLAHRILYAGVTNHYFHVGCREGDAKFGAPVQAPSAPSAG